MDLASIVVAEGRGQAFMPIDDYTPERIELEAQLILRDAPAHVAAAFARAGVGIEYLTALLRASVDAVHGQGLAIVGSRTVYDFESSVGHDLFVRGSSDQSYAARCAIFKALVEQFDDLNPELIIFSCRPLWDLPPGRYVEVI